MIERDELDLNDAAADRFKARAVESRIELLKMLDHGLIKSRKALEGTLDAHLKRVAFHYEWPDSVRRNTIRGLERISVLPPTNAAITVYLRLNSASVPAIYGPSADEMHCDGRCSDDHFVRRAKDMNRKQENF